MCSVHKCHFDFLKVGIYWVPTATVISFFGCAALMRQQQALTHRQANRMHRMRDYLKVGCTRVCARACAAYSGCASGTRTH